MNRVKAIFKADKRPPIIDTIGDKEMCEALIDKATKLAVAMTVCINPSQYSPGNIDTEYAWNGVVNAFNDLMLCAGYLNLEPDELRLMIQLGKWHKQLEVDGKEISDEPIVPTRAIHQKFESPMYMENISDVSGYAD